MKELFILVAPYSTLLFLIALPPEVLRNFRQKTYRSGTLTSWIIRIVGYTLFGIYSIMISEYVVATTQFIALGFSTVILIQAFVFTKEK